MEKQIDFDVEKNNDDATQGEAVPTSVYQNYDYLRPTGQIEPIPTPSCLYDEEIDHKQLKEVRESEDRDLPKGKKVSASDDHEREFEMFLKDIRYLENIFEPAPKCCIYGVPRYLREINAAAYTPQEVSIGPHGYYIQYSRAMEEAKNRYVKKFVERTSMDMLKDFRNHIKNEEGRIRACYAESFNLSSNKFVNIILKDVLFIFELFLRNDQAESRSEFDIFLDTPSRKAAVKLDLQLLENQIPYFVFKELFNKLGGLIVFKELFNKLGDSVKPSGENSDPFLTLALQFFYGRNRNHATYSTPDPLHFTDLRRRFLLREFSPPDPTKPNEHIRDLSCATKLHHSGVKFKTGDRTSLQVSCDCINRSLKMIPRIKSEELELKIPRFEVYDWTELLIRNVMAFEQLHYPWKTHVCNYILFMDFLIDTEEDVDLLVDKGIIFNGLGDNAAIANMFNRLGLQVTPSSSCYFDIGETLKKHYGKPWNHAKATVKNLYFSDPLVAKATIGGAFLVLLTLVQTLCSILQVV